MVRRGGTRGLGRGHRLSRIRRSRHARLRSNRSYAGVRLSACSGPAAHQSPTKGARGHEPPMTGALPILEIRRLRKSFNHVEVLRGIDLAVLPQELVFIIGPSGSGKSTLLRCCNRLEEPTGGSIHVDGVDVMARSTDINAMRRRIGMVFQSFNLYPHMTALGNVALALLKVLGKRRAEAERIGMATLDRVGLADKARSYPGELSGGQQ